MSAEQVIDHILDVMAEFNLRSTQNIETLIQAVSDAGESEEKDSDSDDH